jgi:hypothetical protein
LDSVRNIKNMFNSSTSYKSTKNLFKHVTTFSDLAPILIHNNAYNPVGIHCEKLGTSTYGTSCVLHNSREPTMMASKLSAVFYIKIAHIYIII